MNRSRAFIVATTVFAGAVTGGIAFAQSPATPPAKTAAPAASEPASSSPSTAAQVESWTTKQWEAAKKKWAKDKAKWADCQKQSKKEELEGRKSWSFLYKCMTS